jgi:hypothetical protein
MNKRQRKKRNKIIRERANFFNNYTLMSGRRNGKKTFINKLNKAIASKRYRPFKLLKKYFNKILISIDWGSGVDHGAMTHAYISEGKITITKVELMGED